MEPFKCDLRPGAINYVPKEHLEATLIPVEGHGLMTWQAYAEMIATLNGTQIPHAGDKNG